MLMFLFPFVLKKELEQKKGIEIKNEN